MNAFKAFDLTGFNEMNFSITDWFFFDAWRWAFLSGKGFLHHTTDSPEANIRNWLG